MTSGKDGGVVFLTARKARTTLNGLRALDRKSVTGVIDYPRLALCPSFRASAVIICDVERMSPAYEARLVEITRAWTEKPQAPQILNAPPKALRRYELLKKLKKLGVNRTDVHRLDDPYTIEKVSFPCFIRDEAGHHLTPQSPQLLHSRDHLRAEIERLHNEGVACYGKIVVEFEDTRDDTGLYSKLACFNIANTLIPAHQFWSSDWFVKYSDPHLLAQRPELIERERNFVLTNPHQAQLARLFEAANIDYGRIDYGIRPDGGVHVFEINTNPNHPAPGAVATERKSYFGAMQQRVMDALEDLAEQNPAVRLQWPRDELIHRLKNQT